MFSKKQKQAKRGRKRNNNKKNGTEKNNGKKKTSSDRTTTKKSTEKKVVTPRKYFEPLPDGLNPFDLLPAEASLMVLSFVPSKDLTRSVVLTCSTFNKIASDSLLWHTLCMRRGDAAPPSAEIDWKREYFTGGLGRNLITNPCGDDDFDGWTITSNGGDHWIIEEGYGKDCPAVVAMKGSNCFTSSYGWCRKQQELDLLALGFPASILDHGTNSTNGEKVPIRVSEWFCGRSDCKSQFEIKVILLDAQKKEMTRWEHASETVRGARGECLFTEYGYTFRDYPTGLRYILFEDSGKDMQFWAGHYGAKMTAASVRFLF